MGSMTLGTFAACFCWVGHTGYGHACPWLAHWQQPCHACEGSGILPMMPTRIWLLHCRLTGRTQPANLALGVVLPQPQSPKPRS